MLNVFRSIIKVFDADNKPIEGQIQMFSDIPVGYKKFEVTYDVFAFYGKDKKFINSAKETYIARNQADALKEIKENLKKQDSHYYPINVKYKEIK